jgi:ketosteroid isomerase-like protein
MPADRPENVAIVRKLFDDFEAGEMTAVFAAFDENIEWVEPRGYFAGAGGVRGLFAVEQVLARYPEVWSEFGLMPERFIDAGDDVIVTGEQRGVARATGAPYRGRFCNVWTLAGGKVVRMEAFTDTAMMWKAFGGHPPGTDE